MVASRAATTSESAPPRTSAGMGSTNSVPELYYRTLSPRERLPFRADVVLRGHARQPVVEAQTGRRPAPGGVRRARAGIPRVLRPAGRGRGGLPALAAAERLRGRVVLRPALGGRGRLRPARLPWAAVRRARGTRPSPGLPVAHGRAPAATDTATRPRRSGRLTLTGTLPPRPHNPSLR